jgi:hypothetical protein
MREAEHLPAIRRITGILDAMNAPGSRLREMRSADAVHPPLVPDALELALGGDVVVPPSHEVAILALVGEVAEGTRAPLWFSHETAAMLHGACTLVDCIRTLPRDGALVACDSLFRLGADPADVSRLVSASRGKRGVVQAREILDLSDPRSASPGETVTRLAAADVGLPRAACQLEVPTSHGTYDVDLGWEGVRLAVEFDGAVKYDGDPETARRAEAARQEALEAAGWTVVRVRWDDLGDLAALEQRLRRAYLAARRHALLGLTA